MKQIVNWTFGSFFRTLGKVLLFVCIGFIIANLVDLGDITSNFRITDLLGLQTVKASSTDISFVQDVNIFTSEKSFNTNGNSTCTPSSSLTACTFNISYSFDTNYSFNLGTGYYMLIPFQTFLTSQDAVQYYEGNVPFIKIEEFQLTAQIFDTNGVGYLCQIENGLIICPLTNNKTYNRLAIRGVRTQFTTLNGINLSWNIRNWVQIYKNILYSGSDATTNAINQQTQQQAQEHNQTMQTITDTNTTSDSSSANNFILNQQDDTPNGLTAAVTAPLTIMQNLILASNTPLCFTLNGKQTCIPDGYTLFWGRSQNTGRHWFDSGQFNPRAAFITLFNLVVGGFLCYKMLLSMLRIYNDMLDPTNSKIEVLKL